MALKKKLFTVILKNYYLTPYWIKNKVGNLFFPEKYG
jgi:hypothetical protein